MPNALRQRHEHDHRIPKTLAQAQQEGDDLRRLQQADTDPGNALGREETLAKQFRMNVIMSVYHNRLMTGFDDTREFIDFMAGEHVYLWDIPKAIKLIRAALDERYPWIGEHQIGPEAKPDTYPKFVRAMVALNGSDSMEIQPLKAKRFTPTRGY